MNEIEVKLTNKTEIKFLFCVTMLNCNSLMFSSFLSNPVCAGLANSIEFLTQ